MEMPMSHQGRFLPDRKNSFALEPAFLDTAIPMMRKRAKNEKIIIQSREERLIINVGIK